MTRADRSGGMGGVNDALLHRAAEGCAGAVFLAGKILVPGVAVAVEMGFARGVADRVVYLDQGRVLEVGPPASFFDTPQQERTRASSPAY